MSASYRRSIHTVDSHTEGNPTRVVIGGLGTIPGDTLLEKRDWLWRNDDGLRRMLNFEPRGSGMMCSVVLLPPESGTADFSVIIMEQDEYVPMCGHCMIGVATTVVATGMVPVEEPVTPVRLDTPAGLVECRVDVLDGEPIKVHLDNVESFLALRDAPLTVEGFGELCVDVAYGGDMYAFVDADPLELTLAPENDAALIAAAERIRTAVAQQLETVHPERRDIDTCYQVLFTSAKTTAGDYKQTIMCPPGSIDRSPCGTGTSARVAALFTRGEIGLGEAKSFEGILGTCFDGEALSSEQRGDILYVRPRVSGSAYLTGFHHFVLDPRDPLPEGFRIGPRPKDAPQ